MSSLNVKQGTLYKVTVIESERGWGQNVLSESYYSTENQAQKACDKVNSGNKPGPAPDYYIQARMEKVTNLTVVPKRKKKVNR